jgi:hypothetical protein
MRRNLAGQLNQVVRSIAHSGYDNDGLVAAVFHFSDAPGDILYQLATGY